MAKRKPPFYERRWFQGTVAVVGLLGAVWAFSGAPKPWDVASELSASDIALSNTEIILDASAGMGAPFGDGTKLDAAANAIREYVVPLQEEGLALRRAGGSCDEGGELLVNFGRDHTDDVADAAAEQNPEGESNFAYAVIEAIEEFTASERFRPSSTKQVIVITGTTEDECLRGAPEEIRRKLDRSGIDATFKLVALKVSGEDRERLEGFTAALGQSAEVEFVETEEELEEVVAEAQRATLALDGPLETTDTTTTEATESTETVETPPLESTETTPTTPVETETTPAPTTEEAAPAVP